MYVDASGELERKSTYYYSNGTINDVDYDVSIAQAQIGVANFKKEADDNDFDKDHGPPLE